MISSEEPVACQAPRDSSIVKIGRRGDILRCDGVVVSAAIR